MVKVPGVGARASPAPVNSVPGAMLAGVPRLPLLVAAVAVARVVTLTIKLPLTAFALAVAVAVPTALLVADLPLTALCNNRACTADWRLVALAATAW